MLETWLVASIIGIASAAVIATSVIIYLSIQEDDEPYQDDEVVAKWVWGENVPPPELVFNTGDSDECRAMVEFYYEQAFLMYDSSEQDKTIS